MTNIFKNDEKVWRKHRLFQIGIETLEADGWTVSKERGLGKASVRRISRGKESKLVSIRTTQDCWIAFPPKPKGKGWVTLDVVDVVLAVSVDSMESPKEVLVHWIPAAEMRKRFDAAYKARAKANRVQPEGRGLWIPLYHREEESENVSYVGGGAGLDFPPIKVAPLGQPAPSDRADVFDSDDDDDRTAEDGELHDAPLSIAEAKRRLALTLGVPESSIRISVEA